MNISVQQELYMWSILEREQLELELDFENKYMYVCTYIKDS